MARQILHSNGEFEEFSDARMTEIKSGVAKLLLECVAWTFVFPRPDGG
jgi:hypothetical protein